MTWKRFQGTFIGVAALVLVMVLVRLAEPPEVPSADPTPDIFRFEKEDMVGFKVQRAGQTIEVVQTAGEWGVVGESWRPSRSMVRRVAHQLHDLTARAVVAEGEFDPSLYGLGDDAATVEVRLRDGSKLEFLAGDPNPTSVSYYVKPLGEDTVYVVKKSSMDYYYFDIDEFRERRFATLDADDADRIEATVDGRSLVLERTGPRLWHMTAPVDQDVETEEARTMLGRTGALKAMEFVADGDDADMEALGLQPPEHTVKITLSSGQAITLWVGHLIPDTDPQQAYIWRVEDEAVYAARAGFLEAFRGPLEGFRRRTLLGKHEWDVAALTATKDGQSVRITRSSDDWRWPDDSPIPGSTPKRVAGRAAEVKAAAFHDDGAAGDGLDEPFATVELEFTEGGSTQLTIGAEIEAQTGRPDRPVEKRRYLRIGEAAVVYEVDAGVASVIEDLFREYGRKVDKDAEKLDAP